MIRLAYLRVATLVALVLLLGACDDDDIDLAGPSSTPDALAATKPDGNKGKGGSNAGSGGTGAQIAFSVGGVGIHVMNADGTGYSAVPNTQNGTDPAWSPDRKKLAFAVSGGADAGLYVISSNGRQKTRLYAGQGTGAPAWSPDGSKIAFHAMVGGAIHIFVVNSNGSNLQQATAVGSVNRQPTWSPDGTRMVFYSNRSPTIGLWIMNANGTDRRLLTSCHDCASPEWSPVLGDERIAYTFKGSGSLVSAAIRVITAAGVPVNELVFAYSHGTTDVQPAWSPDGTRLVFSSSMLGGVRDVLMVNADGTGVQRVTQTPEVESAPAWAR